MLDVVFDHITVASNARVEHVDRASHRRACPQDSGSRLRTAEVGTLHSFGIGPPSTPPQPLSEHAP
eukprot:7704320-Pyramimonas_sp.AAC.1